MKLSAISKPIDNELEGFLKHFKIAIKSQVGLVDLVSSYILKQKGKKIRPLLVLLSAKAAGGVNERTFRGASLVELLHTATLVHDDVVDNAEKRRGFPSINAVWKNKIAVLMGDFLLARGLMISVEGKDYDFLENITRTVKRMSEGELLQIQKTRKLDIDEETYFRVISDKTASLFETCCAIGAMSASDSAEVHKAFITYGEKLGIAFQIKDDILDYDGTFQLFGKTIGTDIKDKKITLPLIYALDNATKDEVKMVKSNIGNSKNSNAIRDVIDFVHQKGGIAYAETVAKKYADEAEQALEILPASASKEALVSLLKYVISREK
ncbi:MAG: polyprenyl synthetase family protein [Ignavibacteriales bacterium]|nr:polyprenyl synthetase family protein [Ignavibacteriales bacterium]